MVYKTHIKGSYLAKPKSPILSSGVASLDDKSKFCKYTTSHYFEHLYKDQMLKTSKQKTTRVTTKIKTSDENDSQTGNSKFRISKKEVNILMKTVNKKP